MEIGLNLNKLGHVLHVLTLVLCVMAKTLLLRYRTTALHTEGFFFWD